MGQSADWIFGRSPHRGLQSVTGLTVCACVCGGGGHTCWAAAQRWCRYRGKETSCTILCQLCYISLRPFLSKWNKLVWYNCRLILQSSPSSVCSTALSRSHKLNLEIPVAYWDSNWYLGTCLPHLAAVAAMRVGCTGLFHSGHDKPMMRQPLQGSAYENGTVLSGEERASGKIFMRETERACGAHIVVSLQQRF